MAALGATDRMSGRRWWITDWPVSAYGRDMLTPELLLKRLQPLSAVEGYAEAKAFLERPGTQLHESGGDGRVIVKRIRFVWSYRFERSQNGIIQHIPGLAHFVGALQMLPDAAMLKGVIFENDKSISAFWFDDQTGSPIGFVVCEGTAAIERPPF